MFNFNTIINETISASLNARTDYLMDDLFQLRNLSALEGEDFTKRIDDVKCLTEEALKVAKESFDKDGDITSLAGYFAHSEQSLFMDPISEKAVIVYKMKSPKTINAVLENIKNIGVDDKELDKVIIVSQENGIYNTVAGIIDTVDNKFTIVVPKNMANFIIESSKVSHELAVKFIDQYPELKPAIEAWLV